MLTVGVEIPGCSKPLTCATDDPGFDLGDRVLVEIKENTFFGTVVRVPMNLPWPEAGPPARVVRLATQADEERESHLQRQRQEWTEIARQAIEEHGLPMRVVRTELTQPTKRIQIQFVAEGRVDFRDLVRDLARRLKSRVELRQVGVRDAAQLQGGLGHCGQNLCCSAFLEGFAPVSMRMAKSQGLPLNPTKISGQCGRLMCCLRYEIDAGPATAGAGDEEG